MTKFQKFVSAIILIIFALSSLLMFLPSNSNTNQSQSLKEYNFEEVKKLIPEKENVEFFSFFCPHCYDFEYKYGIVPEIKNNNISLNQYHVDFMTPNSNIYTHAWAIALNLKKENNLFNIEQVKQNLFNLAQNPNGEGLKISNINELYNLAFKDLIDLVSFETMSKSEEVKKIISKQEDLIYALSIKGVPSFFVIDPKLEDHKMINYIDTTKYQEKGIKTVKEFREQIIKDLKTFN